MRWMLLVCCGCATVGPTTATVSDTSVYHGFQGYRLDTTAHLTGVHARLDGNVFRVTWDTQNVTGYVYADILTEGVYRDGPNVNGISIAPREHVPESAADWPVPSAPQTLSAAFIHPDSTEGSVRVTWTITVRLYSLTIPRDSMSVHLVTWKR